MAVFGEFPTHCFPFLLTPSVYVYAEQYAQAVREGTRLKFQRTPTVACGYPTTTAASTVCHLVFSSFTLPAYYVQIKKGTKNLNQIC